MCNLQGANQVYNTYNRKRGMNEPGKARNERTTVVAYEDYQSGSRQEIL